MRLSAAILSVLLSGCAYQTYSAKPVDLTAIATEFRARDPLSSDFQTYLKSQGYDETELPVQHWGLNELTYSALYFHSDIDVARATWRAAQAAEVIAGQRPNPGISGDVERHSEHDNGVSPWTFGLAIDIPIDIAGKRQARMDRASSLSEAARIEIAQAAWRVRSRVYASWIEWQHAQRQANLLEQEHMLRSEIAEMLEARLRAGMASSLELSNARLQLQNNRQLLDTEKAKLVELKAKLASHAGLPLQGLNKIQLTQNDKALAISRRQDLTSKPDLLDQLRESALLNRLDIRAALARYEAAEARLRLEIARQYPDIVLSPGYSYDQGDKIWSFGLSTLLSLLNRNQGNIAEAEAQREIEATKIRALQTQIIGELEGRSAAYLQTVSSVNDARQLVTAQAERTELTTKQFDEGFADRLELTSAKLEKLQAQRNLLAGEIRMEYAIHALEETLQQPLETSLSMPDDLGIEATPE
ncbi:MAG: TolC family protein [Betaproteobacteria bacterium HGW-Betaproteobacteria-2]|nr:MAG: TolC family protein [Betaproteobacteria bacterium HGW-Betaproteobacteria-2]